MGKKIRIPASSLYSLMLQEKKDIPPYEADKFMIGSEGGSFPYYHVSDGELEENLESEVEDSEVDLSSFRKQGKMADIWDEDGNLDSRVRLRLLDIADDFWQEVGVNWVKPEDILLMGSICNYNWSEFSDIDMHLMVDFSKVDEKTDFVKEYFDAKKTMWNDTHGESLKIHGFPIEVYIQDIGEENASNAIYSLTSNEWIKEPSPNQIESIGLNKYDIKHLAAKIMTRIDDLWDEFDETDDAHQIEEIGEKVSRLRKAIKNMRKKSLEIEGEMGVGNLAFKVLRRTEYMGKLIELKNAIYDVLNTIE